MASKWHRCEIQVAGEAQSNPVVKFWETSLFRAVQRRFCFSRGWDSLEIGVRAPWKQGGIRLEHQFLTVLVTRVLD